MIRRLIATFLFVLVAAANAGAQTYQFDDEFNGTAVDTSLWWVLGTPPGWSGGWGLETYHPANTTESGGYLTLTSDSLGGGSYSSGGVQSNPFNFLYGTVTVRAKMAGGTGPWSVIWLLGANCQSFGNDYLCNWPYPGSDEIDIAEILNSNLTSVNQQIHTQSGGTCSGTVVNGMCVGGTWSGGTQQNPDCYVPTTDVSQNWHVYELDWSAGNLVWKIDGVTTCTQTSNVPNTPMFLYINQAIGPPGGPAVNNNTLPQTMQIDYVRITTDSTPIYQVTPSAGANGTISPSSAVTVNPGNTTTFTVIPATGYYAVVGGTCGGSLSGPTGTTYTYTTNNVTAACTVTVSFYSGAPTGVTAAAGIAQAAVSFKAPANGGGPYTVTSNPGGISVTGTGSPIIVPGLINGTPYTFTVTATEASGNTGPASSPSNSVKPFAVPPPSLAELAGTWNFNGFVTGPDAPAWDRTTIAVDQDGTWTITSSEQSDNGADSGSGAFWISPAGILVTNGNPNNILCQVDPDKTVIACTETSQDGSTKLTVGTKQAASYSGADLAGSWQLSAISAGPSYGWARANVTFDSRGDSSWNSFVSSDQTTPILTSGGTESISSGGVITCAAGDCNNSINYSGFLDAAKALGVSTSGATSSTDPALLYLWTRQAASYSPADLAGTWQDNELMSGSGAGYWRRDITTIGSDGTATASYTGSDGSSGSGPAGKLSISSDGVITCASGDCPSSDWQGVMNAAKTAWVATKTDDSGYAYIDIFTKNAPVVPEAPSGATAVPGNAQATVSFDPPDSDGGSPITGYTVTSSPGGKTVSGPGASITVTGLTNGTPYTFTVKATNIFGTGPASSPSNSVMPVGAPGAPTKVIAMVAGAAKSKVSFTAPASNGGSPITGYTVTSYPAGGVDTNAGSTSSPHIVSNLAHTFYTFTVKAANKYGTGPPSSHSNIITLPP